MTTSQNRTDWWESNANLLAVRDFAIQSGLLLRSSSDESDDSCVQVVSLTVLPSLFPAELFHLACEVQQDVNIMVDRVGCDHNFITQVLGR